MKVIPEWMLSRITSPLVRVVVRRRGATVTDDTFCRPHLAEWMARSPDHPGRHYSVEVTRGGRPECDWCANNVEQMKELEGRI